jgi:hypothetical protein
VFHARSQCAQTITLGFTVLVLKMWGTEQAQISEITFFGQSQRIHILWCFIFVLWRVYPVLGKDSVNTFPHKQTRLIIGCLLLGNRSVNTPL